MTDNFHKCNHKCSPEYEYDVHHEEGLKANTSVMDQIFSQIKSLDKSLFNSNLRLAKLVINHWIRRHNARTAEVLVKQHITDRK
jgi:hypothetical protein